MKEIRLENPVRKLIILAPRRRIGPVKPRVVPTPRGPEDAHVTKPENPLRILFHREAA